MTCLVHTLLSPVGVSYERMSERLYDVSRSRYAPVLSAFATGWLDELAARPDAVAVCLGRDGLAPFLAARTLLRRHPRRFRGVHPRRVRLVYVSRPLARGAAADPAQAALLARYLRDRGVPDGRPLLLVDVGIRGSIQDSLQRVSPGRAMAGRYLVLRRRSGDPNGACKRGFLAELDAAPRAPLWIAPSWPPPPGWELGGTLRSGDALFLRRRTIHVLEDLWNGVGESAEGLQTSACGARILVVRGRPAPVPVLTLAPSLPLPPERQAAVKRAALQGVVDGVAQSRPDATPDDVAGATRAFAAWVAALEGPALADPADAHILHTLVRPHPRAHAAVENRPATADDGADDADA